MPLYTGTLVHPNGTIAACWKLETAYGPSSDHAAAVPMELRQRVRKPGEALHVFRDDIYGRVAVAYGDWSEAEQDARCKMLLLSQICDASITEP